MKVTSRALLAVALLCTAPGPRPPVGDLPLATPRQAEAPATSARALPLAGSSERPSEPSPPPAPPAPAPDSTPVPEVRYPDVEVRRAAVRIDRAPEGTAALRTVRRTDGVAHVARVRVGRLPVAGSDAELTVAAVDPASFRPLAPQVVADAVGVWQRLDDGEVAVMHEHAERLDLQLAGRVVLGGANGVDLRVGALASNGLPPVAQAMVDRATGTRLGLDEVPGTILVAVDEDADPVAVAHRLTERLGVAASVVPDPRQPRAASGWAPRGDTVWDHLAVCEASSNWSANTGNGFYGGLQFLPESWWLVGGSGMPHEATREEQIHRAELLLQRQGWRAWPVCSKRLGLR